LIKIIKNAEILHGEELKVIKNGIIIINHEGIIEWVGAKSKLKDDKRYRTKTDSRDLCTIDAEGYIVIPGFINSHTHIGDSIGKDIASNSDLYTRVNPKSSIKKTILEKTERGQLEQQMRNSALSMLNKGITTFVDFREGGLEGIKTINSALKNIPIKRIILGRIENEYVTTDLVENEKGKGRDGQKEKRISETGEEILKWCEGFGISGANENDDNMLTYYKKIRERSKKTRQKDLDSQMKDFPPLIAIHVAEASQTVKESLKNTKKTEIERSLLLLKPDIFIHLTNPTENDLKLLVNHKKQKIVICPRANGILGVGFAPLKKMLELDFTIGIGTDNVMLNSPDILREMDFLLKSQRALEKDTTFIDAKKILKMANVNGGKIFNLNRGRIEKGFEADLVFIDKYDIDMYPANDLYMSIIHRCSERTVKGVMVDGKFVHEKSKLN
jgi:cytosine/adenosine deaminase-related metal-dependent hydrolase